MKNYSQIRMAKVNDVFLNAYKQVENLAKYERYLGAFIFGSVARGEENEKSDLDVIVMVDGENNCSVVSHPVVNGIKLDISFHSFEQIKQDNEKMLQKNERIPMIAESIIVFDKTGKLEELKKQNGSKKRKKLSEEDLKFIKFMIYHTDNKARRNLDDDPLTALLAMNVEIHEILKFHYKINRRWWLSNKRLLNDLKGWDIDLASLVRNFLLENDVERKYSLWLEILDHVAKPVGEWRQIEDMNCDCETCREDLLRIVGE